MPFYFAIILDLSIVQFMLINLLIAKRVTDFIDLLHQVEISLDLKHFLLASIAIEVLMLIETGKSFKNVNQLKNCAIVI